VKLLFDKTFNKDLFEIKDKKIIDILKIVILEFEKAKSIIEISNIKKIKGYKFYYRKRIGNYRIGLKFEKGAITFIRFKHRKDIYKVFP
jgi:mRNA interferase RelE/StbE